MRCIVTGGAGFIGSHIAKRLLDAGHEVFVIDDLSAGDIANIPEGSRFIHASVTEPAKYKGAIEGANVIFHNAASKKNICLKDPLRDLEVNGGGTLRLLELAKKYGVRKFVHASTGSVYGEAKGRITEETACNPVSYYGISKLAGDNYVRYYSKWINTTVLRYFHVYGPRQENKDDLGGVIAVFKRRIDEGLPIQIHGDGEQERVFTYVDDIVDANMTVWNEDKGGVFNCAGPDKVSINQLAEKLGSSLPPDYLPALEGDIRYFDVDTYAIRKLGVRFRGFNKGITTYLRDE